jgi:hypothetical protein
MRFSTFFYTPFGKLCILRVAFAKSIVRACSMSVAFMIKSVIVRRVNVAFT